jgi:hypothetical protein
MTDHKKKKNSSGDGSMPHKDGNMPHKHPKKANRMGSDNTDEKAVRKGAEIENPDMPGPNKKIELDDNPDETRKKIPNM